MRWRGSWGTGPPAEAEVTTITLCPPGTADGPNTVEVEAVLWSATDGREVVVDLSNGHWAYGFQIAPVEAVAV